ncbi:MAG: glycosyl transferase [Muribaculaceae bacterium]|nr:glycosyl transferase [Muribaculaceae bacterium]
MSSGIPKIIHYCWFGRNPLPESAIKCINSWKKFFPDYEIKEWNEDNFDVNSIPYTQEAYQAKKYAFVSDYARFKILYEHGGIYFDTDVEVIRPMDDIVAAGPFMGFEIDPLWVKGKAQEGAIAPGLGLGVNPGLGLYAELLEFYAGLHFINNDGSFNQTTIVKYTTHILIRHGLQCRPGIQTVAGIRIYPTDYFNPLNDNTGVLKLTNNTRSIHWYTKTWLNQSHLRIKLSRLLHRVISPKITSAIKKRLRIK